MSPKSLVHTQVNGGCHDRFSVKPACFVGQLHWKGVLDETKQIRGVEVKNFSAEWLLRKDWTASCLEWHKGIEHLQGPFQLLLRVSLG